MPGASADSHVPTRAVFAASVVSTAAVVVVLSDELFALPQAVKQNTAVRAQSESAIEVIIVFLW